MNYLKILEEDLKKGYSKSDLEKLIGLPENNLSGILKGKKNLSKKSGLKIEAWEKSEKPDPLKIHFIKKQVKINNKPENKNTILKERDIPNKAAEKSQYPLTTKDTTPKHSLWKESDPAEKSNAFYLRFGVFTYDDVNFKREK